MPPLFLQVRQALRRRLVVGLLVLASLVMITVYFRESPNGTLHGFQSAGSTALRPFEIAANRIARPFHDAYNWTADVFHAKRGERAAQEENTRLRQQAIQAGDSARREAAALRKLLKLKPAPAYQDYAKTAVTAEVLSNPVGQFDQTIVIAAGRSKRHPRLRRRRHRARPRRPGDEGAARHALRHAPDRQGEQPSRRSDHQTSAIGVVRHSQGPEDLLFLDRVLKNKRVNRGRPRDHRRPDVGRRLSSLLPEEHPDRHASRRVGQTDVDAFQDVQVMPFVDFSSLQYVLVLASHKPHPQMP